MELKLEVVLSSSIKRKKPWPRFCWLGQEKESVFLLDDKRISEINMVSGRTKKRTPKLHPLLNSVVTMASSQNGMWLCGLLLSGELFLWNRDKDLLKTAGAVPEVVQIIDAAQGNSTKLSLQVSWDGMHVLLVAVTGQVFLWECVDVKDLTGLRDGPVKGLWAHIEPLADTVLPSLQDKEAVQHSIFVKTEVMGDACLSAFVFTSGKNIIVTCLKIQWKEAHERADHVGYSIQWATKTYPMSRLTPPCQPVKSRGALVLAFSPDGCILAIVLNQRKPKDTQVLFVSTQNFVTVSSGLGGCGSKKMEIPSRYIRSYWVGSVSWSPGGLFLACMLKRGSLLMLPRLGGLLTLTSSGCNVDFGPAHFLPLHPLVTYRPPISAGKGEASPPSSSMSVRDVMRQRYSVTWHPRLLYLIVSDGYMATVMRVLDRHSPALLLRTLLKDASKNIEKASRILDKSQIHLSAWLESVSCLNLDSGLQDLTSTVTHGPNTTNSTVTAPVDEFTLPTFLRDQRTFGSTKEVLESIQSFFEDESEVDGPPAGSHMEDGGRLEFASMYDTLHALDTYTDTAPGSYFEKDFVERGRKALHHCKLEKLQSKLLTAWAFGMSLGKAVDQRALLLKHTLCYVVQFAALLHLNTSSVVQKGEKKCSISDCILNLIQAILSFLPWDGIHPDGPHCLGLVVEFTKLIVRLLLTPSPNSYHTSHLSSQSLSRVVLILHMVSDSLDHTYSMQQRNVWSSADKESSSQPPQLWSSDVYNVPLLQFERETNSSFEQPGLPVPQRPSSRLLGVWQLVYNITLQYMEELKHLKGYDGWEEEEQQISVIMSQIQTALQATGGRLEDGAALLSYPGEHLFLCGSYPKSADVWRLQICQERNNSCDRSVFQETRLCLALLYSLLSQYQLREAQELGDHMAQLLLHRVGGQRDNQTADSLPCPWLPMDLHSDTAYAVVQTLGRFMASYFTNQPLHILPPHNVAVLPPLHLPHAPGVGRLVLLCQVEVAKAIRQQHLSEVWTVDYAQDLLLIGGLLPETVWLAYHLGDWKSAVSLSLAYTSYCSDHLNFTRLRRRELHMLKDLEPESIFLSELECLLANKADSQMYTDINGDKSFTDLLEGEDWDLLQVSIQEILKASVMAGVNVMTSPLSSLLDTAKELCSSLPTLVPTGLYLPSPPLYCPQPSPNTQDRLGTTGQFAEVVCRHKVSGVLQRLLLLLRSGHCCHPAAQWYISHLRRARHLLHKIKKKYAYASVAEEEKAFPEGLLRFVTRSGFFRRGPNKDGHLDGDTIQTIFCFRELCALCWMLHVRDQLSIHCRKYQAARQRGIDEQTSDSEVNSACVKAIQWACRFLPFARFLNAEEILQDILLSLVSELPPVSLVADMLVRAFPKEEESVRVPLREKYNSLRQRLVQCTVLEEKEEANELMMLLIQDKLRQRRKHLARLQRHLGPPVLHLWEKEEEDEDRGSKHGMAMLRQLSLGTSLSASTLTDCGLPPLCSDGETAENTLEAISPEQQCRAENRGKKEHVKKSAIKIKSVIQEEDHQGNAKENEQRLLPVVGTWEFELEDEEYLNFLELFLSYVLEKDSTGERDSSSELPLLKGFSSELRKRELHSLTFDVLTTIHRRQRDGNHSPRKHFCNDLPVFRAGCCFKPLKEGTTPELHTSPIWSEVSISKPAFSASCYPGQRSIRQQGLFGLRHRSNVALDQSVKGVPFCSQTTDRGGFTTEQPAGSFLFASQVSVEAVTELQQGLDPKLDSDFPELGRLLEWMVRWANRRALLQHHGKKIKDKAGRVWGNADEGVVIRVKASAPAVLTSLRLLECKYTALLGTGCYNVPIQVPEMQWTVAPVLQPGVERESSVDTGYPGSANTPITGLNQNLQGEISIGTCTDEPEELTFHRTPLSVDQDQQTYDAEQRQSISLGDLDVTPEKEGKDSDSEVLEESSSVTNGNNSHTSETSLKLADLDYSEQAEDVSSFESLPSCAGSPHSLPHLPKPTPSHILPEATAHTELSESTSDLPPNTTVNPPSPQPQNSSAAAATTDSSPHNQPSIQMPQIRQRLGEDLLRLVQHINYMSLGEVLGASFSSLQHAQQNSSVAQCDINVPSSFNTNFIPALSAQPSFSAGQQTHAFVPNARAHNTQFSQNPACTTAGQPTMQSSVKITSTTGQCQTASLPASASGAGVNYQEMQPLSVQAESPGTQLMESRRLIPSSQGLLTTTDPSHAVPSTPMLPLYNGSVQNDSALQVKSLKLLQLHHPLLHNQSALNYPPAQNTLHMATPEPYQHKFTHNEQTTSRKTDVEKLPSVPKRQLSFKPSHDRPPPRNSQPHMWSSEQSRGHQSSLPPALPAHTPMQDLRLLHIQPVPQNMITFPKIPLASSSTPSNVIAAPMGEAPVIKLLHIYPGHKMVMPVAARSPQMTRLISMEELTRSMNAEDAQLQQLRVDPSSESTRGALSSMKSSKRQKRREKTEKARKTEVTFRPNESIIPAQEPEDVPVSNQADLAEEIIPEHDITGFSDSLLSGQKLLNKAISTSAELHAFASTCKRAPDCHDAYTNTDPASPPLLVDKAVSAKASVMASSPKSYLQMYNEEAADTEATRPELERILDPSGRQFLSVLDLEDMMQHVLPDPSPEPQDIPSICPSLPTSAQLHVLAISAIRGAPADPQTADPIQKDLLKLSTDIQNENPLCSDTEHGVSERNTPCHSVAVDQSDYEICRAIKNQSVVPQRDSSSLPTVWFSSRLSDLDVQLAALQKIADDLEKDFSNSRMLVNTIEKLTTDKPSNVKTTTTVKKTVRLSVPQKAWTSRSDLDCEEEEESQEEEEFQNDSWQTAKGLSFNYSTSPPSHRAGPSCLHSPPRMRDEFNEPHRTSYAWTNENLGQSGLSDTVEILDELVKEGYLSSTELDFSTSHTAHQSSRPDQAQSSWMSQKRVRSEDERRELRIWMRRKQRERLAAYQKQRENLRERECKPFTISPTLKSKNRNRAPIGKTREEKEKFTLLEQYNQRTLEACALASDFLTSQTGLTPVPTRSLSAPPPGSPHRSYFVSDNDKKSLKLQSGQAVPQIRPQSAELQGLSSEDYRRRLGLHRPVTFLPGDRLSQVTRRGMLTDVKSKTKHHMVIHSEERHVENKRKTEKELDGGFPGRTAAGRGIRTEQARVEKRKVERSQFSRLQDQEDSDMVLAGLSEAQDYGATVDVSGMEWIDNLSECGSSNLSKIDWAAIERIVASEED
ncbi:ciliogenesis and planar polarity effector 1 isoform X3 [Parambassis ranga]|uniref:Ciliogenesis and planar polarity effector 1 isoform X3 n=1 Tax=Parambassis ranga TaxID=210632 RepID=A0A6P7JBD8_9TELE|nr:ciliogenesis and planar polarity effector 1 isoform X3 [Parambassis ranga]